MFPRRILKNAGWIGDAKDKVVDAVKGVTPSKGTVGAVLGIGALGAMLGGKTSRKVVDAVGQTIKKPIVSMVAKKTPEAMKAANAAKSIKLINKTNAKLIKQLKTPGSYLTRSQYSFLKKQGLV